MPGYDVRRGVFETLLVQSGAAVELDAHVDRLARSVHELYDVAVDRGAVTTRLTAVADGSPGTARLRVTFRPGAGELEVELVALTDRPTGPLSLLTRVLPGGLGGHKWADRTGLDTVLGRPWVADVDPLLVEADGSLLETGRGNVFLVEGGRIRTPRADGRILPGVVRSRVLALLREHEADVAEDDLALTDLDGADEVFVTGSIGGVRSVTGRDGVGAWAPGPVTASVRSDLESRWASAPRSC
jgi:para-aminobenzoate synthetase/4-amino-4-deoxychorismate lyase